MNSDFTPENIEFWIDNWRRNDLINGTCEQWLNSFDFEKINIIVNHSEVTMDSFKSEVRPKIKLWFNVMRHDNSRGPISRNINQSYVHTFLSNKKYCVFAHDSYFGLKGWSDCIKSTNYLYYSAPQGNGFLVMTQEGLKKFGFHDERYAGIEWGEIDFVARSLKQELDEKTNFASMVDIHELWPDKNILSCSTNNNTLQHNSCGLENYIMRYDKTRAPQTISYTTNYANKVEYWHKKKWKHQFSSKTTMLNLIDGPQEEELDFYPWLDLNSLTKK